MKLKQLFEQDGVEIRSEKSIKIDRPINDAEGKMVKDFSHYVMKLNLGDYDSVAINGIRLTSLEGSPKQFKYFDCSNNQLDILTGGPEIITNTFKCDDNKLIDLQGAPKEVWAEFHCKRNPITNLQGIGKDFLRRCNEIKIHEDKIKSHVLGLMLVKDLDHFTGFAAMEELWVRIIRKHLNADRDLLDCQEELISKGLKEYAKL